MLKVRISGDHFERTQFSEFMKALERYNQVIVKKQSKLYPNRNNVTAREYFELDVIQEKYEGRQLLMRK